MLWKKIGIAAGILGSVAAIVGGTVKLLAPGGKSIAQTNSPEAIAFIDSPGAVVNSAPRRQVVPAKASLPQIKFLFGSWCDQIGGRIFFRAKGEEIEFRYVTAGNSRLGLPAVDTGFEQPEFLYVTEPDKTWFIVKKNSDGSQTFYIKQSDYQMSVEATDTGGHSFQLGKCG